jgi:hypothetical protein
VVAVVLPVATHADDVGHETAPSEAIELATTTGAQVAPPSADVSSTAEPSRGVPKVVAVVPVTTHSPLGVAGGEVVVVVDEGGAVVVGEEPVPPMVEVAGETVVVDAVPALDDDPVPVPAPVPPGGEPPVTGLAATSQAMSLRIPVPAGTAAVGTHVAPPSLVASTEPDAWSGPEDAYVVAQQSVWLVHETAVADRTPLRTGPWVVQLAPASELATARGPNALVPTARHHESARQVSAVTSLMPLGAGTTDHVLPPSALTTKAPEGPDPASS